MQHIKSEAGEMYMDSYANEHRHEGYDQAYPPTSAISSGSTKQGSTGAEAGYKCDYCPKSFTRKDHLVRHKANHSLQNHYCQICGRAFKRLDLLQRHEKRNICSVNDYPRAKRQRSSSASSESDSQPPHSAVSASYSNPPLSAPSMFYEPPMSSADLSTATGTDSLSSTSFLDTSMSRGTFAGPPDAPGAADVTDVTDGVYGFGLWPPESWEQLFQNDQLPNPDTQLNFDFPYNSLTPRVQESAERAQLSLASAALVVKLSNAFPDIEHLNLQLITESLDYYWSDIAPTFPFIHRGTFDLDEVPNELIMMMVIVGAMKRPQAQDYSHIVARIRGVLVQNCGLNMPIETLQCFTLCHVHDTWFGTADSQFVAQCLWPVMVAHSRKKGIGVVGKTDLEGTQEEEAWSLWAKDEERRRAVYCILLMDTQLSAFWNQHVSRQLSVFAHNVALPCPRMLWDAPTAGEWFKARETIASPANGKIASSSQPKTRAAYLPGLHPEFQVNHVSEGFSEAVLNALGMKEIPHCRIDFDNSLTVEMLLMGLMAIAWDCRTRGGMGIRFHSDVKHWRQVVMGAVIHLRQAWELNVGHLSMAVELRDMRDTFAISIISVLSDIPMLQVAAGATQVCGSSIGARQYTDARRRLKLWAKTDDAWSCTWQSSRFLRQALYADWGIYTPWGIYLSTLVIWAFINVSTGDLSPPSANHNPAQTQANVNDLLDFILRASERVEPREHLGDLIATSAGRLDSDYGGGGIMQREMGQLLWRLITDGRARRLSMI